MKAPPKKCTRPFVLPDFSEEGYTKQSQTRSYEAPPAILSEAATFTITNLLFLSSDTLRKPVDPNLSPMHSDFCLKAHEGGVM